MNRRLLQPRVDRQASAASRFDSSREVLWWDDWASAWLPMVMRGVGWRKLPHHDYHHRSFFGSWSSSVVLSLGEVTLRRHQPSDMVLADARATTPGSINLASHDRQFTLVSINCLSARGWATTPAADPGSFLLVAWDGRSAVASSKACNLAKRMQMESRLDQ